MSAENERAYYQWMVTAEAKAEALEAVDGHEYAGPGQRRRLASREGNMIKSGPWKGHCGGMHCGNVAKGDTAMTGCQCSCGPCDASRPMPSHDLDAVGFGFDLCVNGPPGEIRRLQRLIAAAKAVVEYEWGDPAKGCGPPTEQTIWCDLAAALAPSKEHDR